MKNRKIEKRGALQISFAWLFAIIVGGFILFLAIYGVTKFMQTEQTTLDARTGKEIGVLLNPLETRFETGITTSLTMPVETRIYNKCNNFGEFGRQLIQISQKSFNKWSETGIDVGFSNKYIFSENYVQDKKFYLFSKPFDFPFKVADLIYITASDKTYCFRDEPEDIEEEILDLKQKNLFVEDCPDNSINVCFETRSNCDIDVDYDSKLVEKNGEEMYFETDALMYAAIFSDKEVYECQVKRIMQRLENLVELYLDKAIFIASQGCGSELNSDLIVLGNFAGDLESSETLFQLNPVAEDLEQENDYAECRLW